MSDNRLYFSFHLVLSSLDKLVSYDIPLANVYQSFFLKLLLLIATEGIDYVPLPVTELTLTEEQRQQCINISIINDEEAFEPTEVFTISLELVSGDAIVLTPLASALIVDDDGG